jgi:hypothetical protein
VLGVTKNRAIPCLSCGYDITGLAREGVCPECASPLKSTLEASILLRSLPKTVMHRIDRGVFILSCAPLALSAGLPLGFIMMLGWAVFLRAKPDVGLFAGIGLGCAGAIVCFVLGAWSLTRPIVGRPLGPAWARHTLRYAGPPAALIIAAFSSLQFLSYSLGPVALMIGRGACQVLSLVVLGAVLGLFRAIERQTQAGRYWYGWGLLALLGVLWTLGYWFDPLALGFARFVSGAEWGGFLLAGTLILQIAVFWSAADSVALEWFAATSATPERV